MATVFLNGDEERIQFGDATGAYYRMDTGTADAPSGETPSATAINAFYTTNWRTYGDLVDQKGIPHIVLYFQNKRAFF